MANQMNATQSKIPSWLFKEEGYEPLKDKDAFIGKSLLSITGVLEHFRLDDGTATRMSPSAPAKILFCLACILMVSLSTNYLFVLVMLLGVMLRCCIMPAQALKRTVVVSFGAAALTALIMLPAVFFGQPHSALLIATKVLTSVGIALSMTLTTPFNELTAALRVVHVPNIFIMTMDLALKNIVSLGRVAREVLTALKLRSVGKNTEKGSSLGGVAGVVFLKAKDASEQSFQAMNCRGFEGEYPSFSKRPWKSVDLVLMLLLVLIIVMFWVLEGII